MADPREVLEYLAERAERAEPGTAQAMVALTDIQIRANRLVYGDDAVVKRERKKIAEAIGIVADALAAASEREQRVRAAAPCNAWLDDGNGFGECEVSRVAHESAPGLHGHAYEPPAWLVSALTGTVAEERTDG